MVKKRKKIQYYWKKRLNKDCMNYLKIDKHQEEIKKKGNDNNK